MSWTRALGIGLLMSVSAWGAETAPSLPPPPLPARTVPAPAAPPAPDSSAIKEQEVPYAYPGIVAFREGQWLGSDHLLNISDHIAVYVEVSAPENVTLPLTSEQITKEVEAVFEKAGITPEAENRPGKPNLPFFHLLIMVFPIRDGYTFSVIGSLFEEVKLPRINLDTSVTMQAITWSRQSINIASKDKMAAEMKSSVDEMTKNFVDRYTFFEKLKDKH